MNNQGKSYDNIAEGFAKMRDSFNTGQKYLDDLINHIPTQSHILDIGCGSGFPIANYLIEKNFQVTGIDGSEELLNIAKKKCPKMRGLYGDVRNFIRHYWRLRLAHLAPSSIYQAKCDQNLIRDPAHLKLELDAFVFPLPLNRTFPRSFGRYGYSGRHNNLAFLPKDKIGISTYDAIFTLDSICDLLKFLHMVV
jgi:SAM-dependent methyltransferase